MSQPHPPIPAPQQHPEHVPPPAPEEDDPRTQSILLPPSQRQTDPSQQVDPPPAEPAAEWAPPPTDQPSPGRPLPGQPLPPPGTAELPAVHADGPAHVESAPRPYDPVMPAQPTGPMDLVPGFGERPPAPVGSTAAHTAPHAAPPGPSPTGGHHPGTSPGMPVGAPSSRRRSPLAALQQAGRGSTVLPALVLGVIGLGLLELGLGRDYGTQSLWDVVPTWSVFATVAALLALLPAVAGLTGRLPARVAWRAGAAGVGALAVFWVLVALPLAASDRGFWLTAALAATGAALWLAPGRTE